VLCSYRYSLDPKTPGSISVVVKVSDGHLQIDIDDTGTGFPKELDPAEPDEEEIAIVSGLVRRLDCELKIDEGNRTNWTASIPLDAIRQSAGGSTEG
jgi:two-component sensor histidine kinase